MLRFNSWRLVMSDIWKGHHTSGDVGWARTCIQLSAVPHCFLGAVFCYLPLTFGWHKMAFSVLEAVGFTFIVGLTIYVLNELWKFLYTTRIGYALGKTISLKNIGEWASQFSPSIFIGLFDYCTAVTDILCFTLIRSCNGCYRWYWSGVRRRGASVKAHLSLRLSVDFILIFCSWLLSVLMSCSSVAHRTNFKMLHPKSVKKNFYSTKPERVFHFQSWIEFKFYGKDVDSIGAGNQHETLIVNCSLSFMIKLPIVCWLRNEIPREDAHHRRGFHFGRRNLWPHWEGNRRPRDRSFNQQRWNVLQLSRILGPGNFIKSRPIN